MTKLPSTAFGASGRILVTVARELRARKQKYCPLCRLVNSRNAFKPSRYDGLAPHCRECEPLYRYSTYVDRPASDSNGGKGRKRIKRRGCVSIASHLPKGIDNQVVEL